VGIEKKKKDIENNAHLIGSLRALLSVTIFSPSEELDKVRILTVQ